MKTSLISARRVIFTPSKEVKDELQNTKISITCYDKDGNIVKRVTSTVSNDVEDEESLTPDPSPTGEGSDNQGGENSGSGSGNSGSQNSGSQSQQSGVAAPVIGGDAYFQESTQVTITGPEGAQIYYSESGDDPDTTDTLYTQPFTISEDTTVKAIAVKDGQTSQVTVKNFTKGSDDSGGFETAG